MDNQGSADVSVRSADQTSVFRWKVCICDDNPTFPSLKEYETVLRDLGIDFQTFGGSASFPPKLKFLCNDVAKHFIRSCHLLLVDMQWTNIGPKAGSFSLPDLWTEPMPDEGLKLFEKAWTASSVDDPLDITSPISSTFLAARIIGDDLKGFWIAAALSHLNPHARIVFFSGEDKAINGPIAGAFMQFKTRPVHIMKKPTALHTTTIRQALWPHLKALQSAALAFSEDAYRWFITCVLLPTLLDLDAVNCITGHLNRADEVGSLWELSADLFFPQWKDWKASKKVLQEVKEYLKAEPFELTIVQRRAIAAVRHDLKRVLRQGMDSSSLVDAETTAYQIGQPGWSIIQAISRAREDHSLGAIRKALSLCQKALESSSSQLWDLCAELRLKYRSARSRYCCDQTVECKPGTAKIPDDDPAMPFDVQFLRRACEALIDNARRHPGVSGLEAGVSLDVQDSAGGVAITYRDASSGFSDIQALRAAITRSIAEKGTHALERGIPLALAFGFHFPLSHLEVKYNDGRWDQLFPSHMDGSLEAAGGFGVRWKFQYPVMRPKHE